MTDTATASLLVIDDDPDVLEIMSLLLESRGYQVRGAMNGAQALHLLQTTPWRPCAILLDLMMPVMDGWDFLAALKNNPSLAPLPVIVLSGAGAKTAWTATPGADSFLEKPVDIDRLLAVVERFCPS